MQWSPQQNAVFEFVKNGRGSGFVEAVAGAGKTTTLVEACALMNGTVAFTAFNKKIATEIQARIAKLGLGNRVRAGTFHSFGFNAWRYANKNCKVDARGKQDAIIDQLQIPKPLQGFTLKLLSLAKQNALGVFGHPSDLSWWWRAIEHHDMMLDLANPDDAEKGVEYAQQAFALSVRLATDLIDFDDMIFMPVYTGMKMYQNDYVLVDEAQDTNPARRALARMMLRPNGRALFVGDRHQAIYGFTGADADAVDQIIEEFNCTSLPLTVTYRCPKKVVQAAQQVVSHIYAHDSAPDGIVRYSSDDRWLQENLKPQQDAILCRNTAPLVETAFALIRHKIPAHVEGKEIGAGLLKLVNRYSAPSIGELHERLKAYLERETQKLTAKGQETKAEALSDRIKTIFVIANGYQCKTTDELRDAIGKMFADTEDGQRVTVTLSTVHKAKGREWDRVFVLGYNYYMPSKYARQEWQMQQEKNLIYVAYTRAKKELVLTEVNPK